VDPERARTLLAAERRELERALDRRGHQDDGDDAGWLEPANRAADLFLVWCPDAGQFERLSTDGRKR
jgi:hypothetical protein